MINTWLSLPKNLPYELACDKETIKNFNIKASPNHKLQTQYFPEPYIGNPLTAKIILLNLNPGIDDDNSIHQKSPIYLTNAIKNLAHASLQYPFIFLDNALKNLPGGVWWNKKLKHLINDTSALKVANGIACIEYHGYPSKNYKHIVGLPSVDYSKYLVEQAIKRGALIIIMRGVKEWHSLVLNLINYKNMDIVRSVQNPCITEKNLQNTSTYSKIIKSI